MALHMITRVCPKYFTHDCMCNLIKYSDIYSKTSGSLWQYYRDEQALDNNEDIINFSANNYNSISFKFAKTTSKKSRKGWRKRC